MHLAVPIAMFAALFQGCTSGLWGGSTTPTAQGAPPCLSIPPASVSGVPPTADQKAKYLSLAYDMDILTTLMAHMAFYPGRQDVVADWIAVKQFAEADGALLEYISSVMSRLIWGLERHVEKGGRVIPESASMLKPPMFAAMAYTGLSVHMRWFPDDGDVDALDVARRRKLVTSVLETVSILAVSEEGPSRSADLDELYKLVMMKQKMVLDRQVLHYIYSDISLLRVIDRGEAWGAMGRLNEIAHWDSRLDGRVTDALHELDQRTHSHIGALFAGVPIDGMSHYKVMPYPFSPIVDIE